MNGSYALPGYNFKPDMNPNYAVYARLSVPIFDWGKRRNTRRAGQSGVRVMEEQRDKVEDRVRLEINIAGYDYSQAMRKVGRNDEMMMEKYREGNVSIVEVINAHPFHLRGHGLENLDGRFRLLCDLPIRVESEGVEVAVDVLCENLVGSQRDGVLDRTLHLRLPQQGAAPGVQCGNGGLAVEVLIDRGLKQTAL